MIPRLLIAALAAAACALLLTSLAAADEPEPEPLNLFGDSEGGHDFELPPGLHFCRLRAVDASSDEPAMLSTGLLPDRLAAAPNHLELRADAWIGDRHWTTRATLTADAPQPPPNYIGVIAPRQTADEQAELQEAVDWLNNRRSSFVWFTDDQLRLEIALSRGFRHYGLVWSFQCIQASWPDPTLAVDQQR